MLKAEINSVVKFSKFSTSGDRFTRCRCNIFRTGKNSNGSDITEEAMKRFIEKKGYANVPVVAHLRKDKNGNYRVGGHDENITATANGIEYISECVPFGVIPESCRPSIEEIEENGEIMKYFAADIILWTHRYPIMEAAHDGDIYFNQSMEAVFDETETRGDIVIVNDLSLSALCLLGIDSGNKLSEQPCFRSSQVVAIPRETAETKTAFARSKYSPTLCAVGFSSLGTGNSSNRRTERYGDLLERFIY